MSVTSSQAAAFPARPGSRPGLAGSYAPLHPAFDELLEPDGSLRPHWKPFVSMMDDIGSRELVARWERARALIRDNGITYNVYDDPDGLTRPWHLDLLPLLIAQGEWDAVSHGLVQRARLLDALLADLYGPAISLAEGLLPAQLAFASPWFLRAMHGVVPPRGRWLHLYAADLVRDSSGNFSVLADRTQAPSGTGYSLENRIVVNRVLPTAFRACNVQRLAPFFITLRETLAHLAPPSRENPRVVLLTPGPYNETYFEHAYLARYLSYALVQGKDLTVRDGKVYLKTLSGLQRVDVILRRVDDSFCDPLELYGRSFLGVPGLVQAVRDGTVAVANALGSGAAQSPALLPYLPGLCRRLLGEELILPSVPTWWCGDDNSRRHVLDNLQHLVVKPAYPGPNSDPVFVDDLTNEKRIQLTEQITARPGDFVAQQRVETYAAPVLSGSAVESRRYVLRAFLADDGKTFKVMPGGLTRVTADSDSRIVSLQRGGGSKDTWILSDSPVPEVSLLTGSQQTLEITRAGGELPSRVADDLYWLGRYVHRAEAIVRLARYVLARLSDPNALDAARAVRPLLRELFGYAEDAPTPTPREVSAEMILADDPTVLRATLRNIRGLAASLRDRISNDAFLILQNMDRQLTEFHPTSDDEQATLTLDLMNRLVNGFLAFGGVVADSMTRGQGWRFLDIGGRLERAVSLTRLVRAALVTDSADDTPVLDALLDIADSALTYRRRYLTRIEAAPVVDLLLCDEGNPRAAAFQVLVISDHLANLPHDSAHPARNIDQQLTLKLRSILTSADLGNLCRPSGNRRPGLDVLTHDMLDHLSRISDHVSQRFFSHATSVSRLVIAEQGGTL
jgi:uncharacterized circularly permuted ATP-grasp superfamily protein/uncharacterized alpha-E superfamily protein